MEPLDRRAAGLGEDGRIEALLEQLYRRTLELEGRTALELREWVERAEAWRIVAVLRECRGNRSAAARRLGIGRRTLYTKMERLGVGAAWERLRRSHARAPAALAIALTASARGDREG